MRTALWERTVTIHINDEDRSAILINNTRDAAYCLLERWPQRAGNCYRRAIVSCADALRGDLPDTDVRAHLVVAAMEAMLTVEVSPDTSVVDPFFKEIGEVCEQIYYEELSISYTAPPTYELPAPVH